MRLQIRNLRRHADLDLTLSRGLTVIRGPNESGKTTIQRALELALTRRVTSGSVEMDALRAWQAGEDDRPWVRLEFEHEGEEGNVQVASLEKAFRGAKGSVALEQDGRITTDPARADEILAEISGIPTEAFFRSTASIRHHELDDLARDEAALRDRLQASISGADQGSSRGRKKLERALVELNKRGDKNPGKLKVAEAIVTEETAALRAGESALSQLERDRDALAAARERRSAAESELIEKRSMLEKARAAERLEMDRDAAKQRFERHRTAVEVSEQIAALEAAHPSTMELPLLREILGKVRDADVRIRELRATLRSAADSADLVQDPTPRAWRPTAVAAMALIALAVGIALGNQLGVLPAVLPSIAVGGMSIAGAPILAALLLLGGVTLAMIGRRQRIRATEFRRTRQAREEDLERRRRSRSMLEHELAMAEALLRDQLASIGLPNLAGVQALVESEEAHIGTILRLRAQLEGLVGGGPAEGLAERRDAAALEIEQKSAALEQVGPLARDARARERLEVEVATAERSVEIVRDEEAGARARVEQNGVDAEQVAAHAEKVATWTEQLANLQRRARVYDATLKAIEAAERATIQTATRYLEQRMVADLDRVTAGRYSRVEVDDEDLGIRVFSPERDDWVDVTSLSQGTLDLVYLAARIGLVRLVTAGRRPPLVLDDPFVTLDDARASRALELLKEISEDFQVIYLTTSDRYDGEADRVCVLEAPVARTLERAGV